MDIFQAIILGAVQGLAEWLPISSQGVISLVMTGLFGESALNTAITFALWLHIGTMFAAIIYYWKEFKQIFQSISYLFSKKSNKLSKNKQNTINLTWFIILTTGISLAIGGALYFFVLDKLTFNGWQASLVIGIFLLITGFLQYIRTNPLKGKTKPRIIDGVLLGIFQGLAAFPGMSRSGTTTSILLFQKYDGETALRLSFLLSVPLIFVMGAYLVVSEAVVFNLASILALVISFIVGYLTISGFMKIAKKISFASFCLFFGGLLVISALVLGFF